MIPKANGASVNQEVLAGIEYRIATTRAEREATFAMIYDAYLAGGLCEPNPWRVRVTPYHLLPTTDIFMAVHQGEVMLTYTVVMDGELGVPMQSVYGREVDKLRRSGIRFGEATCLADRRSRLNGSLLPVFLSLSRLVAQHSRKTGYPPDPGGHAPSAREILSAYSGVRTVWGRKSIS